MDHHLGSDGGALDHAALGGQVALQNSNAAVGGVGVLYGANDFGVPVFHAREIFRQSFASDGHHIRVQQVFLC